MKPKHASAYRSDALAILAACSIAQGQDYFTLSPSQIDRLLEHADIRRYQKPRNANGSRARYFYAMVSRRAQAAS